MPYCYFWSLAVILLCASGCSYQASEQTPSLTSTTNSPEPIAKDAGQIPSKVVPEEIIPASERSFRFYYAGTIDHLKPGQLAQVWLPQAASNFAQEVKLIEVKLPATYRRTTDKKYGNQLIFFEAKADRLGQIPFSIEYFVHRRELRSEEGEKIDEIHRDKYLASSKLIPSNANLLSELFSEPLSPGDSLVVARSLYNAVDDHLRYDKPKNLPWGRGDAVWACGSGLGNCTDFHSLFLSICRESGIPGRFEIGFPIPADNESGLVSGYHCWAKFISNEKWVPVDISEADKHPELKDYYFGNLSPDRVTFSVGRDLLLEPPQQAGPVNFLIYPYVEVDGKPHASFQKRFRYQNE